MYRETNPQLFGIENFGASVSMQYKRAEVLKDWIDPTYMIGIPLEGAECIKPYPYQQCFSVSKMLVYFSLSMCSKNSEQ